MFKSNKKLNFLFLKLFLFLIMTNFIININNLKYLQGQIPQNTACWLVAIGRGIGKLAENKNTCSENEELFEDNCVLKCPKNMIGKRNVCWSFCKDEYEQCGAICVKNQTCSGRIKEYVEKMFEKVEKFVKRKNFLGEVNLESLSEEFTFPKC